MDMGIEELINQLNETVPVIGNTLLQALCFTSILFFLYVLGKCTVKDMPDKLDEVGVGSGFIILVLSVFLFIIHVAYPLPLSTFPWFFVVIAPLFVVLVTLLSCVVSVPITIPVSTSLPRSDVYVCPHCHEETFYDDETCYCIACGRRIAVTGSTIHLDNQHMERELNDGT